MTFLFFAIGVVLLVAGGEFLVKGSVAVALKQKLSPAFIGAVLIGFGTSMPELIVAVKSALADQSNIAVGNALGSNIANMLLILGACALIMPIISPPGIIRRDGMFLVTCTILFVPLIMIGYLPALGGAGLILALILFLIYAARADKSEGTDDDELDDFTPLPTWKSVGFILIGLAGLLFGAHLMVDNAVTIARSYGVSELVIGLTLVAIGTSLPELAVSVIAVLKKQNDVAVGNVIGSSLFNLLFIVGATAITAGTLPFDPVLMQRDIWVLLAVTIVTVFMFRLNNRTMPRWMGVVFLVAYGGYMVSLI